jgi:NitT/TauT family transport system ATP-binding protein
MAAVNPASSPGGLHVELRDVQQTFDGRLAVDVAQLVLPASSFTVMLGRSGCGKSTLLNIVAGLDTPTRGTILHDGHRLAGPAPQTALMFQQNNLFPWMSAHQNIVFALRNRGIDKRTARAQADRLIDEVGLSAFAHQLPARLSGGMRQRIALARTIAIHPRLLLLDEPFSALDAQTRRLMHRHLLDAWRRTCATVLMVTHDLNEALQLADTIVLMSSAPTGHVAQTLTVGLERPRDPDNPAFRALYRHLDTHLEHETTLVEHDGDWPPARPAAQAVANSPVTSF